MTDNVQLKQRSGAQVSRSSVNKTGGRVLHSHREIVNRLKKTPVEERLNSDDNNNSERGNTHTTRDEKEIEIANAGLSHKTSTTEHRKSLTLNALTGRERRRSNGYGYRRSSVLSASSDSQDFNYDDPDDGLLTDRVFLKVTPEEYMRQSYSRICGLEHITPCGSFQRQISDTVADISNSMLGPLDIKCICVALSNNVCIKELDLSGNDLSDKGAVYLAEALHENYTIDDLSVSECSISLDGLRDLCSILLEMKPMKRIDMSKNNFGTQHVLLLAEVIKKNDYIEELVLSGNAIDNIGGTHIGKALMSNVGIKTLDLSWNHIRLQGAVSVCSALRFNQTLEDLDLSWNGLGEEGCKALGAALPLNHTLRQLDISSNRVSFQALMGLLPGLLRNDSLKLIRINSNPMTTDGAIAILKYLIKSDTSQLKDIHMSDVPINFEFLDALNELQKIRDIKVYHRYPNNKKITPIIRERTLHDHDPAMVLFEYMKQENIRLIDLFRTFDTDFSQALTKDELRDGFIKINMPLSDEALDTLFDRFDIDENSQIEYSEVRSNYRKTISKMKYMTSVRHSDSENCFQKQLQNLVKKALAEKRTNYVLNAKKKLQRRISLTAIFKSANPNISFN